MRKYTATLFLLATLSLGCLAVGAVPASAEENVGNSQVLTENGPYCFNVLQYPARSTCFSFFRDSFVEFETVNGEFWMLETPCFGLNNPGFNNGAELLGINTKNGRSATDFQVSFYTVEGKLLGRMKDVKIDQQYSYPRAVEGSDKMYVRIESRGKQNANAKFVVWQASDAVVAKPFGTKSIFGEEK